MAQQFPHMQQQQQHYVQYGMVPQHQQHYAQYQYGNPNQHYGGYGQYYTNNVFTRNAWQAYGYQPDELKKIFFDQVNSNPQNVARQAIQAENLLHVMNRSSSIKQFYGITWSRELCSIMLAMLDRSQDGFMQWEEFLELQQCLVAWHTLFKTYDMDRNGFADAREIFGVITNTFKFNITPKALEAILKRYSYIEPSGRCVVAFDDFVTLSVRLRALTDTFRRRDQQDNHQETGYARFSYDDFIRAVLRL